MGKKKKKIFTTRWRLFRFDLTLCIIACILFPVIFPSIIFEKIRGHRENKNYTKSD